MSDLKDAVSGWARKAAGNAGWLTALGVLTMIAGILAVLSPLMAGLGVAFLVGAAMTIAGIGRIIGAFSAGSFGQGALAFLGGILAFVVGAIIAAQPGLGLTTLTLMLGAYLLVDGVSGGVLAFHVRPVKGWGWMLFSAALSVAVGFMLLRNWPLSGLWAVGTLVGINLMSSGTSMIAIGSAARGFAGQAAQTQCLE